MKKHLKKTTAILIALLMVTTSFSAFSFSASAAESEDTVSTISGTKGNCIWVLDEHGTLTISGEGSMEDDLYLSWAYYKDKIEIVIIEAGLTSIGDKAFSECTSLTSITIPDSVTSIDDFAFYGCTSLTNITIPNSVTGIGSYAFYGCTNLENIVFPDNLTDIGFAAFKETKWFDNQDDGVVYAGNVACDYKVTTSPIPGGSITIVEPGTVSIAYGAFFGCDIDTISIPNTVKKIGSYAFANCTSLNSVTIPPSVKSIGEKAFGYYLDNEGNEKFLNFYDIIFANNKGFEIQGKKNSAAEKYAKDNKFTFTESNEYNYEFIWGEDNLNFNNSDNFNGGNINNKDLEELANSLDIGDWRKSKGGYCFGMTVAEIMFKQKLLDKKYLSGSQTNLYEYSNDEKNKDNIIDLIKILQELQNQGVYEQSNRSGAYSSGDSSPTTDEGSQNSGTTSITQKNYIEKIEEELKIYKNEAEAKNNHSVISIEYTFKDSRGGKCKHAVLGYGIEDLSKNYHSDVTGKDYDKRILIADPNYLRIH